MPELREVRKVDDLDYRGGAEGGVENEATQVREWEYDGQRYRTLLTDENAKAFDEDQKVWTQYAEKVSSAAPRRVRTSVPTAGARPSRSSTKKIRDWAKTQNFKPPVSDRGRIPDKVTDAYYVAHPEEERPAA